MLKNQSSFGRRFRCGLAAALVAAFILTAAVAPVRAQSAAEATPAEQRLRALEEALEALRAEMEEMKRERAEERAAEAPPAPDAAAPPPPASGTDARLAELERRLDVLAAELERIDLGEAAAEATEREHGFGPAASKIYRTERGLSIGGYGEMLYQAFDSERDDGAPSGRTDHLDFLRAVFYFGYKLNDRFLFNSEIELEHASTGEEGSASVEFAYLDYLHKPQLNARAGLLLIPMGFVNELHEPPVFLGAKRPDTERVLIPSTWRENGLGLFGDAGPVTYRTYIVNGLDASGFSSGGLRGGRQKGSEAKAEDLAWVGRLDYTGRPGLLVGGSVYLGDSGQGLVSPAGETLSVGTTLYEAHLEWKWRGLQLRGLVAWADLDDVAELNQALGLTGSRSVGEELEGSYVELGYDLFNRRGGEAALIPYARWESFDTQAQVPAGFARDPAREVRSLTLGLAFRPIDEVIFKADWQNYDNEAGTAVDQVNVAFGYLF